ncbi:MAG: methyltransferase [Clostridia bacterium]|jgi:tRNA G10  N-methylase Trm11
MHSDERRCDDKAWMGAFVLKTYISTFTPGFEAVIGWILPQLLAGSKLLKLYSGLVVYQYNGHPMEISKIPVFNNSYYVIRWFTGGNLSFHRMVNEVLNHHNHYLKHSEWNGRYKTFRVRFVKENQFQKVDKQLVSKAEKEIIRATKLKVNRLKPETEFWYLIRRENTAYYAQLLFRRHITEKNLNKGELRPEFVLLMIYWANIGPHDVVMDPFAGYGSIPFQLYNAFSFGKLIVNDKDRIKVDYLKRLFTKARTRKMVEISCEDARSLSHVQDKSVDKIITDPPWGIYENIQDIEGFYTDVLMEMKRILKDEGKIIVLTASKTEFKNATLACGLKIIDRIDTLVKGKKASLFRAVKEEG